MFKTAPRSELPCSPEVQLVESDVENRLFIVEVVQDGIDPMTWSTPPTLQVTKLH